MMWTALLLAQCCGGARSSAEESKDGRYKVEAVALQPGSHGPYNFRFHWLEREASGEYRATDSFETTYRTDGHFNKLRIVVSPTGNGFLLHTPMPGAGLVFHSPSGRKLYTVDPAVDLYWDIRLSEDGACLPLVDPKSGEVRSRLFLPMGPDPSLLLDLLKLRREVDLRPHLPGLDDDDLTVREASAAAIRNLGLDAEPALEREIARNPTEEARARMAGLLGDIQAQKAMGHPHASRNLALLSHALGHPDERVAEAVRERLRAILPKDAKIEPAWIRENAARVRWDPATQTYR